MSVRLSVWRVERTHPDSFKLWKGNAVAGHVTHRPDGLWYAHASISGRRGSRIGRPTARAAAWHYFGADAGLAVDAAAAKEAKP
jgi:hypothetical protein